jgi:hypothetical protein
MLGVTTYWGIIRRIDFIGRDNDAISMATDSLKNKQSYEMRVRQI